MSQGEVRAEERASIGKMLCKPNSYLLHQQKSPRCWGTCNVTIAVKTAMGTETEESQLPGAG